MPYMFNGVPLPYGEPFTINGFQYGATTWDIWTRAELEGIGLVWYDEPALPFEAQRTRAMIAVDSKRDGVFAAGFPVTEGPLALQHLQLRNADDKANWLIAEKNAQRAIASDSELADVALIPIRTMENQTVVVTPNETLSVLAALETWGTGVMGRAWALKDDIALAADQYELDQVLASLDADWP